MVKGSPSTASSMTMAMKRATPLVKRCFLREMPPEIMEMIIGNISFVDIIAFAEASNWTKVTPLHPTSLTG